VCNVLPRDPSDSQSTLTLVVFAQVRNYCREAQAFRSGGVLKNSVYRLLKKISDARHAGFVIRVRDSCSSEHEHDFRVAIEHNEADEIFSAAC